MAEFHLNVKTPEGEPHRFTCTGENTELYVHHPRYKDVDHVFHRFDEEDRRLGAFVWRSILGEDEFNRIAQFMHESMEYPLYYRPEPLEGDMDQFLTFEASDLDTFEL